MDKYYRVFAHIDMDSIIHNLKEIISIKDKSTELMAIIKADGYGHGAVPISKVLVENGVDRLGVAVIEEGISLRKSGITAPILVLGYTPEYQILQLLKYDLIQTVFKREMAEAISKTAIEHSLIAKIHIKLDTGMGRIGFYPNEETLEIIRYINSLPNLEIEGIFTHFSTADEKDKTFTINQVDLFNGFISRLEQFDINIPIKHACNSAGLIDVKEAHYQLIRAGISIYGLFPSMDVQRNVKLKPALSLKSHVIYLKELEIGKPVSYGCTYITDKLTKVATIPVGYGDGYPRALSSIGRVLIQGQYAPIIGRVCMDQFMVDVTHIDNVKDGDEVVLIGTQGENTITVEEIAELTNTINYEIICGLGKRIPRVYTSKSNLIHTIDYF
ncbi:alanine racemase [Natranaerovirga pectinivora]|uniref:Alanine racemase n=1 Tax=Natranaerovirga pectinivora TaxID=682400 RepID=A0A4R3MKT1_9FIRM|nr:alanine racemase [Natranaerovirga pectinivora]TCT15326.1 alanine racemase [Natranaerovirga pectinivora]